MKVSGILTRLPEGGARMLRFGIVGVANTLVTLAMTWLLSGPAALPLGVASMLAYVVGMVQGFVLNRTWTFGGEQHAHPPLVQMLAYLAVNLACAGGYTLLNLTFIRVLPAALAFPLSVIIITPISFLLSRSLVFRRRA